jgi:hypothetical protein
LYYDACIHMRSGGIVCKIAPYFMFIQKRIGQKFCWDLMKRNFIQDTSFICMMPFHLCTAFCYRWKRSKDCMLGEHLQLVLTSMNGPYIDISANNPPNCSRQWLLIHGTDIQNPFITSVHSLGAGI